MYTVFYIYENIIINNESARQENCGIRISQRTDDCHKQQGRIIVLENLTTRLLLVYM